MIRVAIVAATLLANNSASACHIYRYWRYPWPQHCEASHAPIVFHAATPTQEPALTAADLDKLRAAMTAAKWRMP